MKKVKKLLALLLAVVMLACLLPSNVFAAYESEYGLSYNGMHYDFIGSNAKGILTGIDDGITDLTIPDLLPANLKENGIVITKALKGLNFRIHCL